MKPHVYDCLGVAFAAKQQSTNTAWLCKECLCEHETSLGLFHSFPRAQWDLERFRSSFKTLNNRTTLLNSYCDFRGMKLFEQGKV